MLLRGLAALVGTLPWRVLTTLGSAIGWMAGGVLRIRRAHVEEAMRAARIEHVEREARRMYRSLGASVAEFLWLAARPDDVAQHVTLEADSEARWRSAQALGRGVVIAASHTGNWDVAACTMARRIELLVITKRLSLRALDRFWQATRAKQGVVLSDARGAMGRARDVLRRRGAVAMMIDQVPTSARPVRVEFLGRPALADRAPAALAAACGAPLVVAASRRDASGEHVLHVLDVLVPPVRPARAWVDDATLASTRALDRFVRAYPSQWLWLHRRWKKTIDSRGATLATSCRIRSSSPGARSRVA
jgi:KDO2-lipid IV(A) lauroyltransferase